MEPSSRPDGPPGGGTMQDAASPFPRLFAGLVLLLLAGAAAAQDGPTAAAPPPKGPPALRVAKGARYRYTVDEEIRIVRPSSRGDWVQATTLRKEGTLESLGEAGGGGLRIAFRILRIAGNTFDTTFHPDPVEFNSGDSGRGALQAPEHVRGYMNGAGEGLDFTLSPRGEVRDLAPPADGSPSHFLFRMQEAKEFYARAVPEDLQRMFPLLPEKEPSSGHSWVVKVPSWRPPSGHDLGPFALKSTLAVKKGEGPVASVVNGEPKRPSKGRSKPVRPSESQVPPDFDRGPFDLEIKGETRFEAGTWFPLLRSLSYALTQMEWQPSQPPRGMKISGSYRAELAMEAPK